MAATIKSMVGDIEGEVLLIAQDYYKSSVMSKYMEMVCITGNFLLECVIDFGSHVYIILRNRWIN